MSDSVLFPVEAGHVLLFARAIGDESPEYQAAMTGDLDPAPAPPTFVQASAQFTPGYHLRPDPHVPWMGSGKGCGIAPQGGGILHAEQHFEFHRPVTTGMTLIVSSRPGREWTKEGRRGGTLAFSESITEYHDSDGQLIVTTRSVGVRTERVVEKEA